MDEIEKLQHIKLVSKVCTELHNHLNINDKDLAEYIIHLAVKHPKLEKFKGSLKKRGAEFTDSFSQNLLALIQRMKPPKKKSKAVINGADEEDMPSSSGAGVDKRRAKLKKLFPALARPDDSSFVKDLMRNPDDEEDVEKEEADNDVDDVMNQLEGFLKSTKELPSPQMSVSKSKRKKRKRSRSQSRSPSSKRKSDRGRRSPRSRRYREHSPDDSHRRRRRSRTRSRSPRERRRSRSPYERRRSRSPHER